MKKLLLLLMRAQFKVLSIVVPSKAAKRAVRLFFTPRKHPSKPIENGLKQAATRHELGSGLVYYSWGTGKTVVFIHGWEGRALQVSSLLQKLKDKYQVIAIDAPAHGESEGKQSHPKRFVDALFEVLNDTGPVHAIIGHSMGGGSALYAALQGIRAENIVSIAGPSNFLPVVTDFARFIGLAGSAKSQFLSNVEDTVGIPFVQLDPTMFPNPKPNFLAVHDMHDPEIPVFHVENFDTSVPNVSVAITEGLGHRKILFAEQTADLVFDFLNN